MNLPLQVNGMVPVANRHGWSQIFVRRKDLEVREPLREMPELELCEEGAGVV